MSIQIEIITTIGESRRRAQAKHRNATQANISARLNFAGGDHEDVVVCHTCFDRLFHAGFQPENHGETIQVCGECGRAVKRNRSREEVKIQKNNEARCGNCNKEVKADYKAQDPAPCGCAWVWNERTGLLEAVIRH